MWQLRTTTMGAPKKVCRIKRFRRLSREHSTEDLYFVTLDKLPGGLRVVTTFVCRRVSGKVGEQAREATRKLN